MAGKMTKKDREMFQNKIDNESGVVIKKGTGKTLGELWKAAEKKKKSGKK